jgi:hypothetical protein
MPGGNHLIRLLLAGAILLCAARSPCAAEEPPAPSPFAADRYVSSRIVAGSDGQPVEPSLVGDVPMLVEPDLFAGVEADFLAPHLHSALLALVPLGSRSQPVLVQNARLDATVSPSVEFGMFRTPDSLGEIVLCYRFLASDGKDITLGATPEELAARRSRLDLESFDLDYACSPGGFGPDLRVRCELGARLQIVFFDTRTQSAAAAFAARNYFFGAGPHAGLSVTHAVDESISLYGRVDAAVIYGYNTAQNFAVTTLNPATGAAVAFGTFGDEQSAFSPYFCLQAGLAWSPAAIPACYLRAGYQFEQWYRLGRVANSVGDLSTQGLFVHCDWVF